jgi:NMD protein affecting ribosome stability and mRNA decay
MKTIVITTSCHYCGRRVEDAMHVMLCDRCLDTRLAERDQG